MPTPRQAGLGVERAATLAFGARVSALRAAARDRPESRFFSVYRRVFTRSRDRGEINLVLRELWTRVKAEAQRLLQVPNIDITLREVDLRGITLEILVGLDGLARTFQASTLAARDADSSNPTLAATGVANRASARLARRLVTSASASMFQALYIRAGALFFRWRDRGDNRVRSLHRQLNGAIFSITQGAPGQGLPGEPYGCRCLMDPII